MRTKCCNDYTGYFDLEMPSPEVVLEFICDDAIGLGHEGETQVVGLETIDSIWNDDATDYTSREIRWVFYRNGVEEYVIDWTNAGTNGYLGVANLYDIITTQGLDYIDGDDEISVSVQIRNANGEESELSEPVVLNGHCEVCKVLADCDGVVLADCDGNAIGLDCGCEEEDCGGPIDLQGLGLTSKSTTNEIENAIAIFLDGKTGCVGTEFFLDDGNGNISTWVVNEDGSVSQV